MMCVQTRANTARMLKEMSCKSSGSGKVSGEGVFRFIGRPRRGLTSCAAASLRNGNGFSAIQQFMNSFIHEFILEVEMSDCVSVACSTT